MEFDEKELQYLIGTFEDKVSYKFHFMSRFGLGPVNREALFKKLVTYAREKYPQPEVPEGEAAPKKKKKKVTPPANEKAVKKGEVT